MVVLLFCWYWGVILSLVEMNGNIIVNLYDIKSNVDCNENSLIRFIVLVFKKICCFYFN